MKILQKKISILNKMLSIPIDIVNYICEFAADNNKLWYPFFSPKTEKVSWKVNRYCTKYNTLSRKLLNETIIANLTLFNVKTFEERDTQCKIMIFNQIEYYMKKIYIEFNTDDDNSGRFMFRGILTTVNHYIVKNDDIYLNRTPYASIIWGNLTEMQGRKKLSIAYETY